MNTTNNAGILLEARKEVGLQIEAEQTR